MRWKKQHAQNTQPKIYFSSSSSWRLCCFHCMETIRPFTIYLHNFSVHCSDPMPFSSKSHRYLYFVFLFSSFQSLTLLLLFLSFFGICATRAHPPIRIAIANKMILFSFCHGRVASYNCHRMSIAYTCSIQYSPHSSKFSKVATRRKAKKMV